MSITVIKNSRTQLIDDQLKTIKGGSASSDIIIDEDIAALQLTLTPMVKASAKLSPVIYWLYILVLQWLSM